MSPMTGVIFSKISPNDMRNPIDITCKARVFSSRLTKENLPCFVHKAHFRHPVSAWELVIDATFRNRKALPTD
jgi:hypothetical protein